MKIVKFPSYYDCCEVQRMLNELKRAEPEERFVAIPDNIDLIDLSTQDLYTLRKEIDDAIHDKEIIENMQKEGD